MKSKCEYCNINKLNIIPFSCRCDYKKLCIKCRLPEDHKCTFDYVKYGKNEIIKNNPVIIKPKLTLNI